MMQSSSRTSIVGYSERGLVNAMVRFLAMDVQRIRTFLEAIEWQGREIGPEVASITSRPFSATFLIEPGFADFGDPDLILLVTPGAEGEDQQKQPLVFFLEAKITSWENSAKSNEIGMKQKGFNSSINGQLSLKYRLGRALAAWDSNKSGPDLLEPASLAKMAARPNSNGGINDRKNGKQRHLHKPVNLSKIAHHLKPSSGCRGDPCISPEGDYLRNVSYIALTLDETNPLLAYRDESSPDADLVRANGMEPLPAVRHISAPWYFPTEDPFLAMQAWANTGWCGWESIEGRLDGLIADAEYGATREVSIGPIIKRRDHQPIRSSGSAGDEIRTRALDEFPETESFALRVAELTAGVAQDVSGLDVGLRRGTGSFSVVVNGSVVAKVVVQPDSSGAFVLLGLASDCTPMVPSRFDHGVRSVGVGQRARPFCFMRIDPGTNLDDPDLVAVLHDYFSALV